MAVDALNAANWQRGAKKGSRRPKPLPRPWSGKQDRYGHIPENADPEKAKAYLDSLIEK